MGPIPATTRDTITLDGGAPLPVTEWEITREVIYARSMDARLPDPRWRHVDTHDHEHRWRLPENATDEQLREVRWDDGLLTLERRVEVESCGGECGDPGCEYTVTTWHCRVCGDQVRPGTMPDYEANTTGIPIPGMVDWTVTVELAEPPRGPWDSGNAVPFELVRGSDGQRWTGKAHLGPWTWEHGFGGGRGTGTVHLVPDEDPDTALASV